MAQQIFYEMWHMRVDKDGQDHDKLLDIYSTREKAEQALAALRNKTGFRDYPDGFEINDGPLDETCFTDGFVTVWGEGVIDKAYFPHGFVAMDGRRARDVEVTPAQQPSLV